MNINNIWSETLDSLKTQVSSLSYDLWAKTLEPIDVIDGILYLSTTSVNAKESVLKLLGSKIKEDLAEITDEIKDFVVLAPYEKEEYLEKLRQEQEQIIAQSKKKVKKL